VGELVEISFQYVPYVYRLDGFELNGASALFEGQMQSGSEARFDLRAVGVGSAQISLRVYYGTERRCYDTRTGETLYYELGPTRSADSPSYSVSVDPGEPTRTPTEVRTAPATPTETPPWAPTSTVTPTGESESSPSASDVPTATATAEPSPTQTPESSVACEQIRGSVSFLGVRVQPEQPRVGDAVRISFPNSANVFSLSGVELVGAGSLFCGPMSAGSVAEFDLTAVAAGDAQIALQVSYGTELRCYDTLTGQTLYFTSGPPNSATSPPYPISVAEAEVPTPPWTPTELPTAPPTRTVTPTPTPADLEPPGHPPASGGGCSSGGAGGSTLLLVFPLLLAAAGRLPNRRRSRRDQRLPGVSVREIPGLTGTAG